MATMLGACAALGCASGVVEAAPPTTLTQDADDPAPKAGEYHPDFGPRPRLSPASCSFVTAELEQLLAARDYWVIGARGRFPMLASAHDALRLDTARAVLERPSVPMNARLASVMRDARDAARALLDSEAALMRAREASDADAYVAAIAAAGRAGTALASVERRRDALCGPWRESLGWSERQSPEPAVLDQRVRACRVTEERVYNEPFVLWFETSGKLKSSFPRSPVLAASERERAFFERVGGALEVSAFPMPSNAELACLADAFRDVEIQLNEPRESTWYAFFNTCEDCTNGRDLVPLNSGDVDATFRKSKAIAKCVVDAGKANSRLQATLMLRFTVDSSGQVSDVAADQGFPDQRLQACVVAETEKLAFPIPRKAPTRQFYRMRIVRKAPLPLVGEAND
jgi:hypothetical protein